MNAIFTKLGISAAPVHRRIVAVLAFLENSAHDPLDECGRVSRSVFDRMPSESMARSRALCLAPLPQGNLSEPASDVLKKRPGIDASVGTWHKHP